MIQLDERYYNQLNHIAGAIQESETLAQYLEEEEDDLYKQLTAQFEPYLNELHHLVASEAPLQLMSFEKLLLDPNFEGLHLPRVLGYAVLRGEINNQCRYVRPNDHFKDILLAICHSPHFDQIKKRIGQSIQVGFALSSDIWITNLLSLVENKRIRQFLTSQKNERFHSQKDREEIYRRYSNQFRNELYYSADFPTKLGELKANFSALKQFLMKRFEKGEDNSSLNERIKTFLNNAEFFGTDEYLEMMVLYGNFMSKTPEEVKMMEGHFARERANLPEFNLKFLSFMYDLYKSNVPTDAASDGNMSAVIDKKVRDKVSDFYFIADKVHSLGYIHPETIEAVKDFYETHEGLSIESDCLRQLILNYFQRLVTGLSEKEYTDYFELTKIFSLYIKIFGNAEFDLAVEKMSMIYVQKLMAKYTDKRGKDYQDIKKFVSTHFVDLGFLKDKEVVEMFKTRRKRKKEGEN